MADTINHIAKGGSDATLILYGDVANGLRSLFYTQRQALLVNGRVSSMLWGSNYPDAPPVLISDADLLALWGNGPRRFPLRARRRPGPRRGWPIGNAGLSCKSSPTKHSTPTGR